MSHFPRRFPFPQLTRSAWFFLFLLLITISGPVGCVDAREKRVVLNPYENVHWDGKHRKGNFHAHTTESDGSLEPAAVIDRYHEKAYDILAITDHNHVTWPWKAYGRRAAHPGMVPIPGNELSRHEHNLSLFSRYPHPAREKSTGNLETSIQEVSRTGGLNVLAHPGRYWDPKGNRVPDDTLSKYVGLFKRHDRLIGMEVHNQTDRYPHDRRLWDALLDVMMPERPIWGLANDDSHGESHVGLNASWFPMRDLNGEETKKSIRRVASSMKSGRFYFSTVTTHPEGKRDLRKAPKLTDVTYNAEENTLTLEAKVDGVPLDEEGYTWISNRGETVAKGPRIQLGETENLSTYLRAELRSDGALTYTQPFGLTSD